VGGGAAIAGGAMLGWPLASRGAPAPAQIVLRNGFLYTLDRARPVAQALAVTDGQLAYVGSAAGVESFTGPGTEVIDLNGRMVMPGIHDGHIHPLAGGRQLTQPNLNAQALQRSELLDAVAKLLARSRRFEPDTWLEVVGWDAVVMKNIPTKRDLDRLETSRPILIRSLDGHAALANSRALQIAGVSASTDNPEGGRIAPGRGGSPTGLLYDNAISLVGRRLPNPTNEQNAASLEAAYEQMIKQGVTSHLEAATGETDLKAMALLSDRGQLPVRSAVALEVGADLAADPGELTAFVERMRGTYGRPDIAIRTVKMFFDGVMEYPTQTAALLEPYLNPKGKPGRDRGPTYFPRQIINPAVRALDAAGWQVHVHAIGDRAVRLALDGFEHARRANARATTATPSPTSSWCIPTTSGASRSSACWRTCRRNGPSATATRSTPCAPTSGAAAGGACTRRAACTAPVPASAEAATGRWTPCCPSARSRWRSTARPTRSTRPTPAR